MIVIRFDEFDAERSGERSADQALAGSGDTHDDIETVVHQLQFVGSRRLGNAEAERRLQDASMLMAT
jgi:hypothetical protein